MILVPIYSKIYLVCVVHKFVGVIAYLWARAEVAGSRVSNFRIFDLTLWFFSFQSHLSKGVRRKQAPQKAGEEFFSPEFQDEGREGRREGWQEGNFWGISLRDIGGWDATDSLCMNTWLALPNLQAKRVKLVFIYFIHIIYFVSYHLPTLNRSLQKL